MLKSNESPRWETVWAKDDYEWMDKNIQCGKFKAKWMAVNSLFEKRRWWTRVWTLQEMALATDIIVRCGEQQVTWRQMAWMLGLCDHQRDDLASSLRSIGAEVNFNLIVQAHRRGNLRNGFHPRENTNFLNMLHNSGHLDLVQILYVTRNAACTDARDKVYGILGLAVDGESVVREPDYNLAIEEVYKKLVVSSIEVRGNMDILSLSNPYDSPAPYASSPSPAWIPSLLSGGISAINKAVLMTKDASFLFKAALSSDPQVSVSTDLNVLSCSGYLVDFVESISDEKKRKTSRLRTPKSVDLTPGNTFDAICHSLLAGLCWSYEKSAFLPPPPTFKIVFAALFLDSFESVAVYQSHSESSSELPEVVGEKTNREQLPDPSAQNTSSQHRLQSFISRVHREVGGRNSEIWDWYQSQKQFSYLGITLEQHAKNFINDTSLRKALPPFDPETISNTAIMSFVSAASTATKSRRLFSTHNGRFGLGPTLVRPGDAVCVLLGHRVPVILSRPSNQKQYRFGGDCYVHGLMNGEAITNCDGSKVKIFEII